MQLLTFFDAGTIWSQGNPFSSKTKNPTDIRVVGFEPVVVELQTLKSPFIYSFGLGFRMHFLGYLIRSDLAWGVDDNSLQPPVLSFSVGRGF